MSEWRDAHVVILPDVKRHIATYFNEPDGEEYETVDWLDVDGVGTRRILVRVDGPQLLSVSVEWGDCHWDKESHDVVWSDSLSTDEFTYSGAFFIHWANTKEDDVTEA